MSKKTKNQASIIIRQGVKLGGQYLEIGRQVSVDIETAEYLVGAGAAEWPVVKAVKTTPPPEKEQLLEQIKKAETQEALEALVAGHEDDQDVVTAATDRLSAILDAEKP